MMPAAPFVGAVTPQRYAECRHVVTSRRGAQSGPVDDALQELGLQREILAIVPTFVDALTIARHSDLVALVSRLTEFELPVATPELAIKAMWHPRLDADPAHRWFRETLIATCRVTAFERL